MFKIVAGYRIVGFASVRQSVKLCGYGKWKSILVPLICSIGICVAIVMCPGPVPIRSGSGWRMEPEGKLLNTCECVISTQRETADEFVRLWEGIN